jgi:6-pyruvoyltetrahydropterin/6-carboxytetrahydropterin synthase
MIPSHSELIDSSSHYTLNVFKEYFNFAASHFLIFKDGTREPLHGHNYRVRVKLKAPLLQHDMVIDFLDIKPLIRQICQEFDHKLLLPGENDGLMITEGEGIWSNNFMLKTPEGDLFSIPKKDVLILPLTNTSVERMAYHLNQKLQKLLLIHYSFNCPFLRIEVEETLGQSAGYTHVN